MDLLVWVGVIIVYLLNFFLKKSSKKTNRPNKENPEWNRDSTHDPFEEIRKEIIRKKKEREEPEVAEVEFALESDKPPETKVKKLTPEVDEPSQFQLHMEEQSHRIKEKQEEAERLKIYLETLNTGPVQKNAIDGHRYSSRGIFAKSKVRAILAKKNDIKSALIAGEILAQPLATRREIKSESYCL